MSADFTPTMGTYKELKPFRYWCQKVLPLVYDDTLSYYELLCKVVDYLNMTMEDVDTLHGDVDALHDAYVSLQGYVNNYFDNLDVQQEINNKLDEMATDGTLITILQPTISDEVAVWMAEHITPTTPGIDNTLTVSGAGADAKVTGDWLRKIDDEIVTDNSINILEGITKIALPDNPYRGITSEWVDETHLSVSGTATDDATNNFYLNQSGFPIGIKAGDTIYGFKDENATTNCRFEVFLYINNSWSAFYFSDTDYGIRTLKIPSTATGMLIRCRIASGTTVNTVLHMRVYRAIPNIELSKYISEPFLGNNLLVYIPQGKKPANANDLTVNSVTFVSKSAGGEMEMSNVPYSGFIFTVTNDNYIDRSSLVLQYLFPYKSTDKPKYRVRNIENVWGSWIDLEDEERMIEYNCVNLISNMNKRSPSANPQYGITVEWVDESHIKVTGTATEAYNYNFYYESNAFPDGLKAGEILYSIQDPNASSACGVQLFAYVNNSWSVIWFSYSSYNLTQLKIPDNATGLLIRVHVDSGTTVDTTLHPQLFRAMSNKQICDYISRPFLGNRLPVFIPGNLKPSDANNINCNCFTFVSVNEGVTDILHTPYAGFLVTLTNDDISFSSNIKLQLMFPYSASNYPMYRLCYINNTWSDWIVFGGSGETTYNNTYNISVSPTITTDTNGWLQAIDDDTTSESSATDMTSAIMALLTATGYCHLSEGVFYVSGNIELPVGGTIEGCGKNTKIVLLSSATGYAIKLNSNTTIKDLVIAGSKTDVTLSNDLTNRAGIYSNTANISNAVIDNVSIERFTGSGIYLYGTGGSVKGAVQVTNVFVTNCRAGVNIAYSSEYNKFANTIITNCHFACINNGGNNVFSNCTFHGVVGFVLDNSNNDKPNNSHGSCVGCTFNHIDNLHYPELAGMGDAVKGINQAYGFIFSGCQFWYGEINLDNCTGFMFEGCYFGGHTPEITAVTKPIFLIGCMFQATPEITAASGSKAVNCYDTTGTAVTIS